jgi:hypothetical protein
MIRDSLPKDRSPDFQDAQLIIKLYELRREPVMRQSRDALNQQFWPKSYEELRAVTKGDHPLNAAWRQLTSFWEMAYGMARHGIVNADYLTENAGEGILLYAKVHPHLEQLRNDWQPTAFRSTEWLVDHSAVAKQLFARFQKRVEAMSK